MESKPRYNFDYIKNINSAIFEDFNDLIEAYLSNIQASIFSIANALFEKGFRYFLIKEGKMAEFFPLEDPSFKAMVFSTTNSESRDYIRNRIFVDYRLIDKVRTYSNQKKHSLISSNPYLDKMLILTELFSLYVQLNNRYS